MRNMLSLYGLDICTVLWHVDHVFGSGTEWCGTMFERKRTARERKMWGKESTQGEKEKGRRGERK